MNPRDFSHLDWHALQVQRFERLRRRWIVIREYWLPLLLIAGAFALNWIPGIGG